MALGLPILTAISFFFLDQTVWKDDKKDNNTTTATTTTTAVAINDNSGGSDNDNKDKSNDVVDDDDDDLGKDNDEIEGQEQHNHTTIEQKQEQEQKNRRSSVTLFVDKNLRNGRNSITVSNMSMKDYINATKEIAWRYLPLYFVNFGLGRFWMDALYQPSFVSSSTTYHGFNQEEAITTSDSVLLSAHIGVFVLGLTIYTCLGTIIPQNLSPYWLWVPNICQAILLSVVLSGVAYGTFPVSFMFCFVLFCSVLFYRDNNKVE
jgi:hypothetical protein